VFSCLLVAFLIVILAFLESVRDNRELILAETIATNRSERESHSPSSMTRFSIFAQGIFRRKPYRRKRRSHATFSSHNKSEIKSAPFLRVSKKKPQLSMIIPFSIRDRPISLRIQAIVPMGHLPSQSPPEQRPLEDTNPTPLAYLRQKVSETAPVPGRTRAVLLCTGSLNPVHVTHLRVFDIAAKFLKDQCAIDCLVGFLSPSCDLYVQGKLGADAIPFRDRHRMCVLSCEAHNADPGLLHVECDSWEGLQKDFFNFPTVRERMATLINEQFPDSGIVVLYVCGSDHFLGCGLHRWYNCVAIGRPSHPMNAESDPARGIYLFEVSDEGYADLFGTASSTEVRRRIANKEPLDGIVYPSVAKYLAKINYQPQA
jgi:nicotinic acid mononucleotide adenylyltransferase